MKIVDQIITFVILLFNLSSWRYNMYFLGTFFQPSVPLQSPLHFFKKAWAYPFNMFGLLLNILNRNIGSPDLLRDAASLAVLYIGPA